jgi:predicted Zn-dependent protease
MKFRTKCFDSTERAGALPLDMVIKVLFALAVAAFLLALLFPRAIPGLLRRLGRSLRSAGQVGKEAITGEEVEHSPLARYEVRAGEMVALKVLAEHPAIPDAALQEAVGEVGRLLARHAARREIPYRFTAVAGEEPNAFAVPGGAVFITRPLLELCAGDTDSLAGVLGHEVVHIDRRHALHQLARSAAVRGGIRLLTLGRGMLAARLATGMRELLVQGYRREQELEADLLGSRLAARAGFDPRGLVRLLERLERARPDGTGPLAEAYSYFRSHPPVRERIGELERALRGR